MRADLIYLEANQNDVVTVNTSPRVELFKVSTYTTTTEATVVNTLLVAEKDGIEAGDSLWVGTNAIVVVSSVTGNASGAGTVNLTSFITYNNNDAVLLAKKAGVDDYVSAYDDPDNVTAVSFPFAADDQNNFRFYVAPGDYGVRYSDTSNNTLRAQNGISFGQQEARAASLAAGSETYGIIGAFRRLPSTGGVIDIPGGTYMSEAVHTATKSFVTYRGAGVGRTVWKFADASTNIMFNISSAARVVVEDIEFDGNTANTAGGVMVAVTGSTFVWFRRCKFKNTANHSVRLSSAAANVYFEDCEFTNWGTQGASVSGIFVDAGCSRVWIRDSYFHDATALGTSGSGVFCGDVSSGTVNDIHIDGCDFDTIGTGSTGRAVTVAGATAGRDIFVRGNKIRSTGAYGIFLRNMDGVTVADNPAIFQCGVGIALQGCRRATVHHNGLHRCTTTGVLLESLSNTLTPNAMEDTDVSHNVITDTDPSNTSAASGAIRVVATDAADTRTHRRLHIRSNIIEHDTTSMAAYGIRFQAQAASPFEDVSVVDNYVERCKDTGISIDDLAGGTILGNTSKGNATDSFIFVAADVSDLTIGPNDFDDVSQTYGSSTLNGTTAVTITTRAAHTGMKVAITRTQADGGGNNGFAYVDVVTDGTSFTVKSTDAADNVTFDWAIVS